MKIWAVLLSPFGGAFSMLLPIIIWSVFSLDDFIDKVKFATSLMIFIYLISLLIQVFIIEIIMMCNDFLCSLKGYCWLTFILSFLFAIPISKILENNLERAFLILLIYSIGNISIYNCLYFSKLEK